MMILNETYPPILTMQYLQASLLSSIEISCGFENLSIFVKNNNYNMDLKCINRIEYIADVL